MFLLQFVSSRLSCHAKNMHSACLYNILYIYLPILERVRVSLLCCLLCYCVSFIIEFNVILCQQHRTDGRRSELNITIHILTTTNAPTLQRHISCGRKRKTKRSLKFTKTKTLHKAPEYQINFIHFALITVMVFSFFLFLRCYNFAISMRLQYIDYHWVTLYTLCTTFKSS